jgi:L-fuconolactonase
MPSTRRAFLGQTALAALPLALTRAGDDARPLPIVDTHQHLWDLTKFRLAWVTSSKVLNRSFLTKDYLEASRGLNVVKAVYMEVAVDPSQLVAEAEHVIALSKRTDNPTAAAVIGGRPAAADFKEYLSRFKGNPYVKGVRQVLFQDRGLCLSEAFMRGVRLLGEYGMSFDLCLPAEQLADGARLVESCPETRFIVDHCGNADPKAFRPAVGIQEKGRPSHDPDQWRRDMARLAKAKNTVCKISGIVARADEGTWKAEDLAPVINHCLDTFGADRVMFGSDWPVCTRVATYHQWVTALKEVVRGRSHEQQLRLFHDNAVRFYGL